jgi:hypothetical protein
MLCSNMITGIAWRWLSWLLLTLGWLHAHTIGPLVDWLDESVLGAWEESTKLFVREFFVSATRLINGCCAFILALFDRNYRDSLRRAWKQKEAWHSWWREERQSTLNAVLASQCPAPRPGKLLHITSASYASNHSLGSSLHMLLHAPATFEAIERWQKLLFSCCPFGIVQLLYR